MAKVIEFDESSGASIKFIVDDDAFASIQVEAPQEFTTKGAAIHGATAIKSLGSFGEYFDPVRKLADELSAKISQFQKTPQQVEVSVGVKLTTEVGVLFAKAGADADMTIKLVWK